MHLIVSSVSLDRDRRFDYANVSRICGLVLFPHNRADLVSGLFPVLRTRSPYPAVENHFSVNCMVNTRIEGEKEKPATHGMISGSLVRPYQTILVHLRDVIVLVSCSMYRYFALCAWHLHQSRLKMSFALYP